jgi:ribonuclease HII
MCLATVEQEREEELRKIGVKDSKLLTPKRREHLYGKIREICTELIVMKTTAATLNDVIKKRSLNEIEAMELGKALSMLRYKPQVVYIDSPDTVAGRFCSRISKYHQGNEELLCEHKADFKYPIVSAASIIAKVERDAVIEEIKKELACDFGSGYTSDDRTISFLKKNFHRVEVHKYIRMEWETIDNIKQRKLNEFDADE